MRAPCWQAALLAAVLLPADANASTPHPLAASPVQEGSRGGFGLFTRSAFRWVGNRVLCDVSSDGQICGGFGSFIGGAFWPAGTSNQYIFNTGLQFAGRVDPASANNPWSNDIEGAFFFNIRGGGNGQPLTYIFNSADPADLDRWPDAARVPSPPDLAADLYDPTLHGQKTASDNDIWFLTWDGDPNMSGGRGHPLGILVETRGLALKSVGKNDFLFFIHTFYNISASDPAAYVGAPLRIRPYLQNAGLRFHDLNAARGDTLPAVGYTIEDMYLAIGTDLDVTFEEAGSNYSSVNVPMAMGYSYHHSFTAPASWTFDPTIYRPPFFAGSGFVGIKYLRTPEVNGVEAGLTLFASLTGSGQFTGPRHTQALYRYLTGNLDPLQGDDACNVAGSVALTRICFVALGSPSDTRFYQSTGPMTLAPGEYSTIAVAYVFAAPVAIGACTGPDACGQVRPDLPTGSLLKFFSPDSLLGGVNRVDSIAGYRGYLGDRGPNDGPADGRFNTYDLDVVPGSLLGKAALAQAIFDRKFSQPTPPKAPNFFLIPGDSRVTVVWQPSATEVEGDPYTSSSDPNYRAFDVAGYRIYRGSRADPASLTLLAQFDIAGDVFVDHTGQVNTVDPTGYSFCVPDLRVYITCDSLGVSPGGVNLTVPRTISLDGPMVQYISVTEGVGGLDTVTHTDVDSLPRGSSAPYFMVSIDSLLPAPGTPTVPDTIWGQEVLVNVKAFASQSDTALTGNNSGLPGLFGTGIPYSFVDSAGNCLACGVANHRSYFYLVTAFDLNSVRSGPSSLESTRAGARPAVPAALPSNTSSDGSIGAVEVVGRNGVVTGTMPTLDAVTGRFSGPMPPANSASVALLAFLPEVLPSAGAVTVTLDSIALGDPSNFGPHTYYWHSGSFAFTTSVAQDFTGQSVSASARYDAVQLDPGLAARYGGGAGYRLPASLDQTVVGAYYAGIYGRGCLNAATGFYPAGDQSGCDYNGPRWFMGPSPANNETKVDPIAGNGQNFTPGSVDNSPVVGGIPNGGFNNAGALTGVEVIHQVIGYQTVGNQWRNIEGIMSGAKRAADYNVHWSATTAGLIDSVIDVTHDVAVPFSTRLGASYGILTSAAAQPSGAGQAFDQRAELSLTDFGCVEPMRSIAGAQFSTNARCGGAPVGDGPVYLLSRQASIGNIVHFTGTPANAQTSTNTGTGFAIYMPGSLFMFQTSTLPQGVVWAMRDYVGAITGGNGYGGNDGPYRFYEVLRPFSAAGAGLRVRFTTDNVILASTRRSLNQVHTVPDPYYLTNTLETENDSKIIKFVNLPTRAIIRIYSSSGVLVRVLEHNSLTSSELTWDVRNRGGRFVASGVYFYHIEALNARRVGRMTVVHSGR